jgi:hypothetical protein
LIRGAQSLFGVKTQLQFGKTTITGVFSEQKSQTKSVTAQGGGTFKILKCLHWIMMLIGIFSYHNILEINTINH